MTETPTHACNTFLSMQHLQQNHWEVDANCVRINIVNQESVHLRVQARALKEQVSSLEIPVCEMCIISRLMQPQSVIHGQARAQYWVDTGTTTHFSYFLLLPSGWSGYLLRAVGGMEGDAASRPKPRGLSSLNTYTYMQERDWHHFVS